MHPRCSIRVFLLWAVCLQLTDWLGCRMTPVGADNATGILYWQASSSISVLVLLTGAQSAACASGDFLVTTATGSVFGPDSAATRLLIDGAFQVSYVVPADSLTGVIGGTDGCLSLSAPYLPPAGLWLSDREGPVSVVLGYSNSSGAYSYSFNGVVLLPPPLVSQVSAPTAGALFNSGFDLVIAAAVLHLSSDYAVAWDGNYTVTAYSAAAAAGLSLPPAPPLPGEAAQQQTSFVELSGAGASILQASQPLVLYAQYELSWFASCGDGATAGCSYEVSIDISSIASFNASGSSWQPQSLLYSANPGNEQSSYSAPTPLFSFSQLTGAPLLDSVALTPTGPTSPVVVPSPIQNFQSWLFANSSTPVYDDSVIANVTIVSTQLPNGSTVAAALLGADDTATVALTNVVIVQGNRSYSFSLVVSAAENVSGITSPVQGPFGPDGGAFDQGVVAVFLSFVFYLAGTGANIGGAYDGLTLPPCSTVVTSDCAPVSKPTPTVTRRRLLQLSGVVQDGGALQYWSCLDALQPCNSSLLLVQVSIPGSLSDLFLLTVGVQTQGLDLLVTSPLLLSTDGSSGGSAAQPGSSSSSSTGVSAAVGDPMFVGLRGQRYQVHGVDGQVYSLIIDSGLRVNARFSYLAHGSCPAVPEAANCWSHPGSYIGDIGIWTAAGDRLLIHSGGAQAGFAAVTLNGRQLSVSASRVRGEAVVLRLRSAFRLSVTVGNFELSLENSDHFVNVVGVRVLDWANLTRAHGLLGQTWRRPGARLGRQVADVEGFIDDYAEANNDLLGNRFLFQAEDVPSM